MGWDNPDNHAFMKTLLCTHAKRLETLWKWYSQGNDSYSYITDWFWQGHTHTRYAPNITIGAWSPAARSDSTDPDYLSGGHWQFTAGLHFYPAAALAFVPGLQSTLLEDLSAKMKWTPVPTWPDIEAALFTQLYTDQPTPYVTTVKEPGFFRAEAVGALLNRARLLWETPIEAGSVVQTYIGCGRVQPSPDDLHPSGEFVSRTFIAFPATPTLLQCWAVRCGCCICGK